VGHASGLISTPALRELSRLRCGRRSRGMAGTLLRRRRRESRHGMRRETHRPDHERRLGGGYSFMHLGEKCTRSPNFSRRSCPFSSIISDDKPSHPQLLQWRAGRLLRGCMARGSSQCELQSTVDRGVVTTMPTWKGAAPGITTLPALAALAGVALRPASRQRASCDYEQ